jgi:2-polyprenyl-3-methyl-5-hydroxy-6-metoxy-1,4-benzoquinol methylase
VGERPDVLSLVRPGIETLLDCGCSTGTFGLSVKNRFGAVRVTGIEYDPAMADRAQKVLDKVCVADLNATRLQSLLPGETFDCIVTADVLEHLIDPWGLLRDAVTLLNPGGRILTSIPNVRHISTIVSLVFRGRWPYRKRGIHDVTHLRFFTRTNIVEMLEGAGLRIVRERRNLRIVERPSGKNKLAKLLDLPGLRPFYTFQYLHESAPREDNVGRQEA